jgi:putative membrane protein
MLANVFITFVALLHLYFLVLEMFFWDKPLGLRTFKQTYEKAKASKLLAANQGLYNGFLAVGLLWGLYLGETKIKIFFLSCVVVAGIFGGFTVNKRIMLIQALPAVLALALVIYR